MEYVDYRPPSDRVIELAQKSLGMVFHPDYISFIKSGYDLGGSILEPLEIDEPDSHVDMYAYCKEAWGFWGVPPDLLPIVHDNSDFYCVNSKGGIDFWSHDAKSVSESWISIADWISAMKAEA